MSVINTEPSPYYFLDGKIGIISDAPGGLEAMKQRPDLEAKTLAEWESQFASTQTGSADQGEIVMR